MWYCLVDCLVDGTSKFQPQFYIEVYSYSSAVACGGAAQDFRSLMTPDDRPDFVDRPDSAVGCYLLCSYPRPLTRPRDPP